MMNKTLSIKLNDALVGYLTHYQDGKNVFTFSEDYLQAEFTKRPQLSMSFTKLDETHVTRHRLPSFFSNLLPEGELRTFIANQLNIHPEDEFSLLAALGHDLPGAIIAEITDKNLQHPLSEAPLNDDNDENHTLLHFSLAGVQMKFSMLKQKSWFTLTKNLLPGNYIIKTPSIIYPHVPENEYSMMMLAKAVGIEVPEVQLISIDQVKHLPFIQLPHEKYAYAIKRFDRKKNLRIHIEDFAQAFEVKPQKKYQALNYETLAKFIYTILPNGEKEIIEFLKRLFFNILIGNTDAHLKNWSLIYKDAVTPSLAPVYDLVSTLPYIQNRQLALNFSKQKSFYAINLESLRYFAKRTGIPEKIILDTAKELVETFKSAWADKHTDLPIRKELKLALKTHWELLSLYNF